MYLDEEYNRFVSNYGKDNVIGFLVSISENIYDDGWDKIFDCAAWCRENMSYGFAVSLKSIDDDRHFYIYTHRDDPKLMLLKLIWG